MKKFIPLMLACLLAVWSCELRDSYTQTNVQEMLNVVEGKLVNDGGYTLTVVEDQVGAGNWKVNGARYLAKFDILSRDLEICLKEMTPALVMNPQPYVASEDYPKDPSGLYLAGVSGGYLNLGFAYHHSKTSNTAHQFWFYYSTQGSDITVYVYHQGYSEDLVHMTQAELNVERRVVSLPFENIAQATSITVVMYAYSSDYTSVELEHYSIL